MVAGRTLVVARVLFHFLSLLASVVKRKRVQDGSETFVVGRASKQEDRHATGT